MKYKELVSCLFFPLIMIDYFLIMLGININTIIIIPLLISILLFSFPLIKNNFSTNNLGSFLLTIWIAYNLTSIFHYLTNGLNFSCYIGMLRSYIFPMLFFYYGVDKTNVSDNFFKSFWYSALFCFIVGLFLYFTAPPYYTSYLVRVREETFYMGVNYLNEDNVLDFSRFSSFFSTSYAISYYSIPALCISLHYYSNSIKSNKDTILSFFAVLICLISAILCQQRIAIVASLSLFVYYVLLKNKTNLTRKVLLLVVIIIISIFSIRFIHIERVSVIIELVVDRFHNLDFVEAMSGSRSIQYNNVLSDWNNYLLGDGLGSHSGNALKYGYKVVTDGEFIKILVESGLLGFVIFLVLMFSTLVRAIIHKKHYITEFFIVFYFLVAGIASNSLSIYFYYTPIFWFCVGRIWNQSYYYKQKSLNI